MSEAPPTLAIDNDIVIKAAAYGLVREFWTWDAEAIGAGVLESARFVARARIGGLPLRRSIDQARKDLDSLIAATVPLNPTESEALGAAELEAAAALAGLELDNGESQLAAIVVQRGITVLETGDKRAVVAIETLLDSVSWLRPIAGRIRCLEQIACAAYRTTATVWERVCAEPDIDKALSYAFSCLSDPPPAPENVAAGLDSYIRSVRRAAPRSLWSEGSPQ